MGKTLLLGCVLLGACAKDDRGPQKLYVSLCASTDSKGMDGKPIQSGDGDTYFTANYCENTIRKWIDANPKAEIEELSFATSGEGLTEAVTYFIVYRERK
jgi:hypothetical protein